MTNFTYTVSDHGTHASFSDNLTWVRNMSNNHMIVTDAGHGLPRKSCAGMSEMDATTQALIEAKTLILCSAPAATTPPTTPKAKSRSLKRETLPDTESAPADSNETTPKGEASKSEES
jgi:hypothetical protein